LVVTSLFDNLGNTLQNLPGSIKTFTQPNQYPQNASLIKLIYIKVSFAAVNELNGFVCL